MVKKGTGKVKARKTCAGTDFDKNLRRDVLAICEGIKKGHCGADAARLARVAPRTWESWLEKAKKKIPRYEWILAEYEAATAAGIDALLGHIIRAAPEDWRAAAWVIERRGGAAWQKPTQVALSGGLDVSLGKMTDSELEAELAKAREEAASGD